ncbi:MAG: Mrp/NBP35 family ATP-binding protein [Candidatus Helarchaeota archaeon]|nr:Mrp/NBP35 family ATP-binding protein [Candidatus Helarchaeota archaeon]
MFKSKRRLDREKIIEILKTVSYPGLTRDIVSFGFVKDVIVKGSNVTINVDITTKDYSIKEKLENDIRNKLCKIDEISNLKININLHHPEDNQKKEPTIVKKDLVPQIRYKIAVASGKGGVGKSTVAVNLAVALGLKGYKVGLFDSDIYGPSIPTMLNVEPNQIFTEDNKIIPIKKYGIKLMSIGFFLEKDTPLIWRGPMVMKAIQQFLEDVKWVDLDYLIIDLPPGTGDAQLSISQLLNLSGAIIVTTPQDLALVDAVKGVQMFLKLNVPVIGIVENMSYFICPKCGERTEIFGYGGGIKESSRINVPFLGEIPINPMVRVSGDTGRPIVLDDKEMVISKAFNKIIEKII